MRYIVGYTADRRGAEAIALAAALARTQGAALDLIHVLDNPSPMTATYPPERSFQQILAGKAESWLDEGLALVPDDVEAAKHVRYADSFAEGLIEAAQEFEASLIVVGAARQGLLRRVTVGSVANALLHSSPVPVALAPSGYANAAGTVSRMTAALGTREGAEALLDVAVEAAGRRSVPLRLVSLVAMDAPARSDGQLVDDPLTFSAVQDALGPLNQARAHIKNLMSIASETADTELSSAVIRSSSIEEGIDELDWEDDEIAIIGSSRLAERRKIFLGTTANKMMRSLPVPMIVVPRDHVRV